MDATTRRTYDSPLRREQTRQTWERIVAAARSLMLERGYARTSMADVAERAGVARQTVYAACHGGKAGLARLVYDVAVMGDADPTPLNRRDVIQELIANPDQREKLRGYGLLNAAIWQRLAPVVQVLRDAAGADPAGAELTAVLKDAERRRLAGAVECAENVAAAGPLRDGMTPGRAGEVLLGLSSLDSFVNLTALCGWTVEEYGGWLADCMIDAVLPGPAAG